MRPGILPRHIAFIMDGNGRWAQARGLPRLSMTGAEPKAATEIAKAHPAQNI